MSGEGEAVFLVVELQVVGSYFDGEEPSLFGFELGFKGHRALRFDLFPERPPGSFCESRIDIGDRQRKQFVAGESQKMAGRLVDVHETALRIHPMDGVRSMLQRELRPPQRLLRQLAVANVNQRALNHPTARVLVNQTQIPNHPGGLTILAKKPHLLVGQAFLGL
jgi:hypothetical protein